MVDVKYFSFKQAILFKISIEIFCSFLVILKYDNQPIGKIVAIFMARKCSRKLIFLFHKVIKCLRKAP